MKSKNGKKRQSNNLCTSVENIDNESKHESLQNKDLCQVNVSSQRFTVSLDKQHKCSKHLKTSNVAFLHPCVIRTLGSTEYYLLRGERNVSLCKVLPLKTVKKQTIILPKESMGFMNEELLCIDSYDKSLEMAEEIEILLNVETKLDSFLKKQIYETLSSKKYICCGMQLKCISPICILEFKVTNIKMSKSEICYNINNLENIDISVETNISSASFKSWMDSRLKQSFIYDSKSSLNQTQDESISQLDFKFSSLNMGNKMVEDIHHSNIEEQNIEKAFNSDEKNEFCYFCSKTSVSIKNSLQLQNNQLKLPSFNDIGGLKKVKSNIRAFMDLFLFKKKGSTMGVVMLLGPSGTGKSMIMEALHTEYNNYVADIHWSSLYSKMASEAEEELRDIFENARKRCPSVIVMDDFNFLCPNKKTSAVYSICTILSQEIYKCRDLPIVIVASSNNSDYDDKILKCHEISLEEINVPIPSTSEREQIIYALLSKRKHMLSAEDIIQFSLLTQGFTGKDLGEVLTDATAYRIQNQKIEDNVPIEITFPDLKHILKYKKPSIKSNLKIKEVRWNDIGGMEDVKEKLKDIVEAPLKHPQIYKQLGIRPSRGVLLYGPPGCSKTMIAKALATECCLNFISKNVSDIHNKYVGESEKAISELFVNARLKSPCIIFLDEIDALIPIRGSSTGSGVEEKIVSLFLQELDGFMGLDGVIIIAATNRPDRIDKAFLRNGRINDFIYVSLPNYEAREEIIRLQMKKRAVAKDFDYVYLARKTDGFSGAEIVNLCNEAALQLLLEECDPPVFNFKHFEKALFYVAPRTDKALLQLYENFNTKFK